MKKIKLLLATAALLLGGSVFAQTDAEYADANAAIEANGVYKIYTLSDGTTTGSTKYYLKTDGYLTDDAAAAGQFTFDYQRVSNNGHKHAGYRLNQFTNGGDNSNKITNDALYKILTTGYNRVDYEAQVFYKNEDGFAIRSTNSSSSSWGASAFWTVVEDNDEDGLPNATYTMEGAQYIWQLEKITAGEFSDVTYKYINHYNPYNNGDGWTVTNGNRLNQWASNPVTYDSGNMCAEFWNNQGATLKQVLNSLPAGFYNLTAVALARDGHTTTLSAGSTYSTPLVTVAASGAEGKEGTEWVNGRGTAKTWFNNGNGRTTLPFIVDETSNVEIGLTTGTTGDAWTVWREFYLTYSAEPIELRKALATVKSNATAALNNGSYSSVTGYERTQLTASVEKTIDENGKTPSQMATAYNELIGEINNNLTAFTDAVSWYAQLVSENTRAAMFSIAAQTTTEQSAKAACDVQTKAVYNYVMTNYNTSIDLGEWTKENAGDMTGQHWDGSGSSKYNEQKDGLWGSTDPWTVSYSQDIVLPAGDYVFKVAGRHSAESSLELIVKKGETLLGNVSDFPVGDTGRGIATDGTASFADAATYANGKGRGWQWRYVPFTIEEESATITISVSGGNPDEKQYQWLSFCNYTVQSAPSVAASTVAYNQAKETAVAARDNDTYVNVQGTDRSGLVAAIEADKGTTIESIDAAAEALKAATTTFTAAKASWDKLVSTRAGVSSELPYASSEKKSELDAAVVAEVTGNAANADAQVAVIEQKNRLYVESNAMAEGVVGAENKTSLITNPNADENADGWSGGFGRLSGEAFTQGDGTSAGGYFDKNGASSYTAEQTIENLAAGKYLLTITARAQSGVTDYKVKATNSTSEVATGDVTVVGNQGGVFGRGFNDASVEFLQKVAGNATIGITAEHSSNFWLSFDRVRLVRLRDLTPEEAFVPATDEDYALLNGNLAKYVLGFEAGEFAPYNNSTLVQAIAAAKAIDQDAVNSQEDVQTAAEAITSAGAVANLTEVNGFYDGFFTIQTVPASNTKPLGWNRNSATAKSTGYEDTGYQTRIVAIPEGVTASNVGMMTKMHAFYGDQESYTLPLKGNTYYIMTFKYAGYNDQPTIHINVYSEDGTKVDGSSSVKTKDNKGHQQASGWADFTYIFKTADAGNYVIGIIKDSGATDQKQVVVTDLNLVKAPTVDVTMSITSAKYATFIAPFDVEIPVGVAAYGVQSADEDDVLTLEDVETTIPANTPVILKSESVVDEVFSGQNIATKDSYTVGWLTGVYTDTPAIEDTYVLQKQDEVVGFYHVETAGITTVNANRAYLTVPSGGGVKAFFLNGGDADGIKSVFDGVAAGKIFDLSGRKVAKMQKGNTYIVNGKKVNVK